MIELTTGVVFLMSSLYGAGQANAQVAAPTIPEQASTTESSSFTNPKNVEAYVRATFANEPILVDIARCESRFHQYDENGQVTRGIVNSKDVGVMQINEKYHADEAVRDGMNIYTVEGNVAYAKHLYDKFGTDPWSSSEKCWGDLARK